VNDKEEYIANWRKQLLQSLAELSDLEGTRQDWLSSTNSRDFTEDVCGYFEDLDLNERAGIDGLTRAVSDGRLRQREAEAIRPFHEAFDRFCTRERANWYMDPQILEDPEWAKIAELAAGSYAKVKSTLIGYFP
jgi:hypothetical protein